MIHSIDIDGVSHVMVRPSIIMAFFCRNTHGAVFARGAISAFDKYIDEAPDGSLTWYNTHRLKWKSLTGALLKRHRKALSQVHITKSDDAYIEYRGMGTKTWGDATEYGMEIDFTRSFFAYIQFHYPFTHAGSPDEVIAKYLEYAALIPYEAGSCGLTIMEPKSDSGNYKIKKMKAYREELLHQYLGFQHHPAREAIDRCGAGVHWLNLINRELLQIVGGEKILEKKIGQAQIITAPKGGILIRASRYPGIGAGTNPGDIGLMPAISKALIAIRPDTGYECDAQWYQRWDNVNDGPFENPAPEM